MYRTLYRTYYRPGPRAVKPAKPVVTYSDHTLWAAAAYADRVNGGYFREGAWNDDGQVKEPNRILVKRALRSQDLITEQDQAMGTQARDFFARRLTWKSLQGTVTDFERTLIGIVNRQQFTDSDRLEIAITASQISAYQRANKEATAAERIDHSRGYLAEVGAKVQATVEITRVVYSQNYGVYFVSGITDTNQAVFFSYREAHVVGTCVTVRGTVKAHRPDATQLSRVRIV